MAIVRWDSSRDVTALQERISRMLEASTWIVPRAMR